MPLVGPATLILVIGTLQVGEGVSMVMLCVAVMELLQFWPKT